MLKKHHLKCFFLFFTVLSFLVFAHGTKAQMGVDVDVGVAGIPIRRGLPNHWSVVPIDAGDQGNVEPNANNIIFFSHPSVSYSTENFNISPSHITYGNTPETLLQELDVGDLLGAPGFSDTSPRHWERENMRALLADPAGLCYEPLFSAMPDCSPRTMSALSGGEHYNLLSWQQLIADLRSYLPEEARVADLGPEVAEVTLAGHPDMEPYDQFGLGSFIGNLSILGLNRESPEAICYDIVKIPGGVACPVFGKIFILSFEMESRPVVELQSPILIYRQQSEDHPYHLAGYLANPTPLSYELFDDPDAPAPRYMQQHLFPVAMASLNSFPSNSGSMVVMNTATQPFSLCHQFNKQLELYRQEPFPWGRDCTYGVLWQKTTPVWSSPRATFDSTYTLLAAPKIYDLAVGRYDGKEVLFAPSNAPATEPGQEGKFYVLKYFENLSQIIDLRESRTIPAWLKLVAPRLIEVTPPEENRNFGPFKIALFDINTDGYSDFVLTWKEVNALLSDPEQRLWTSRYSPFFSFHLSDKNEAGEIIYHQTNIRVPEEMAEIAAIAFGRYEGRTYIVAGDNKRQRTEEGNYHASVHVFPATDGIVDTINVRTVRASFKPGRIDTPGVADLTTDPSSGVISAALRSPFFPAPETCEAPERGVYGHSWLGEASVRGRTLNLLDSDHDGIPNRCECVADGFFPDETNDPDGDELANVRGCDDCAEHFNVDLENSAWEPGRGVVSVNGDGVADACDNCPPRWCPAGAMEGMNCYNPRGEDRHQADADNDGVGDSCDACPETADLRNGGVYGYGAWDDFSFSLFRPGNPTCPSCPFCTHCANAFVRPDGTVSTMDSLYGGGCSEPIVSPGTAEEHDIDDDGVPDARDNCVKIYNPPRTRPAGTGSSVPSGQEDWDNDGSGDACDPERLGGCGRWDDCDSDGVPNRFDPTPVPSAVLQPPDTVYDPYANVIADRKDLRLAYFGMDALENVLEDAQERIEEGLNRLESGPAQGGTTQQRCAFPERTWPGPNDCDHMGKSGREVNVLLPTPSRPTVSPYQCVPGGEDPRDRECTPPPEGEARQVSQYCIARVGRENKKTAAIFTEDQERIIQANDQAQAITGIPEFDIFAGAEGGIIHWECVFAAGAYVPSAAADAAATDAARAVTFGVAGIPQEMNAEVAPFLLAQLSGLPPIKYNARPDLRFEIKEPQAMILAPIVQEGVPSPELPNLNVVLPDRQLSRIPAEGVQVGELRENIHGNMVFKVLHAGMDVSAEGTAMAVNDLQSLVVIDYKTYPEPFTGKPIEQRMYNVNYLLSELRKKVEKWRQEGKRITVDIYRDLPWEESMRVEFLLAQGTVPGAVETLNEAAGVEPSVARVVNVGSAQLFEALPPGHTNSIILPLYSKASGASLGGGGCGCRVSSGELALAELLLLLCLFAPVPVLLYYRQRKNR